MWLDRNRGKRGHLGLVGLLLAVLLPVGSCIPPYYCTVKQLDDLTIVLEVRGVRKLWEDARPSGLSVLMFYPYDPADPHPEPLHTANTSTVLRLRSERSGRFFLPAPCGYGTVRGGAASLCWRGKLRKGTRCWRDPRRCSERCTTGLAR
ncbi:hypothetical protein HRbin30_00058 [bacterium HR30]|nr:hypothetical protein HRbin30_00058 [bacterium HR30]